MTTAVLKPTVNERDIQSSSTVYLTARSGGTLSNPDDANKYSRIGQNFTLPTYSIWETFFEFDLSSLAGATVSSAVLAIWPYFGGPGTVTFTMEWRDYDFGAAVTTADWVAGASLGSTGTLRCHKDIAPGITAGYVDMVDDALAAAVTANLGGTLRLIGYSARQAAGTVPIDDEYTYLGGYASPTSGEEAKLTVVYTSGPGRLPAGPMVRARAVHRAANW